MTVNSPHEELGRCPVAHGQQPVSWSTRYAARWGMGQRRRPPGVPVYDEDIYSVAAIRDPYPHYRAMRALGPVVWLQKQGVYAITQYAEVRQVLADDATYRSSNSVSLQPIPRKVGKKSTLLNDGDVHAAQRKLVAHRLTPRALRSMRAEVDGLADQVVKAAVDRDGIDGVEDIALRLPLSVVPDLIGWPHRSRDQLVRWAGAIFDMMGPLNSVSIRSVPASLQMLYFVHHLARKRDVLPGSMAHELIEGIEQGRVDASQLPTFLMDYLGPSIDTTASAIAAALWLFATHPDQWRLLRDKGTRSLSNAVNEVVRIESPLRAFARRSEVDSVVAGVRIPAGSQLLVMYASANRDENAWTAPDRFDITRDASAQIGFGYGTHGCAGQGLSRMETEAILGALLRYVDRIELTGTPEVAVNNVIHRFETLPLRLVGRRDQ